MATRRYTRTHPCPICSGWDDRSLGDRRCWGAVFDEERALCANVESEVRATTEGHEFYVHFLKDRKGRRADPLDSPETAPGRFRPAAAKEAP